MVGIAVAELSNYLNRPAYYHNINQEGATCSKTQLTCLMSKRVSQSSYARQGMRRFVAGGVITLTTVLFVAYHVYVQPQKFLVQSDLPKSNFTPPVILVWTSFFSDKQWLPVALDQLGCKIRECKITYDRASALSSSVIVFHWRDVDLNNLPASRPDGQLWALFNKESPPHTPGHILNALSDRINWTITYRRDSDFWAPYGRFVTGGSKETTRPTKKQLIAWLVSNCNTEGHRENYVQELSRYIPVDIYGKCGKAYCTGIPASKCYQKLGKRYKFYLSFENSICRDYVTEKAYYPLVYGMIPVVFGGGCYGEVLPPNSYIDALNFTSPQELADYLLQVANDSSKYQSYFEWTKHFSVEATPYGWLCKMCEELHKENLEAPSRNIIDWWYKKSECKTWKEGKVIPV